VICFSYEGWISQVARKAALKAVNTMAEPSDSYPLEKRWHITRGVPLALIFTVVAMFIGQTVGGVWYFSHLDSRVDMLERAQILSQPQGERLTRLEEKVVAVQATANRIESLLIKNK
jgi:hypothetical protein